MKLLGLSAGFFLVFFAGGWLLSAQISSPQASPPSEPLPLVSAPALPVAPFSQQTLQSRGPKLFTALFDQEVFRGKIFAEFEPQLTIRFQAPYPKNEREFHREAVSRVGILKALGSAYEGNEAAHFYRQIASAPGEDFLVRAQALRNAKASLKFQSETARQKFLAKIPGRVRALASRSEAELAEEIFRAN